MIREIRVDKREALHLKDFNDLFLQRAAPSIGATARNAEMTLWMPIPPSLQQVQPQFLPNMGKV